MYHLLIEGVFTVSSSSQVKLNEYQTNNWFIYSPTLNFLLILFLFHHLRVMWKGFSFLSFLFFFFFFFLIWNKESFPRF
jgi:hypothetical protein